MSGRRGMAAAVATGLTAAAGLSACGVNLGLSAGSVGACYRAIPTATAAVHDPSARLVSVHRVPADVAETGLTGTPATGDDDTAVCAVVLHGRFATGQVTLAPPGQQGTYALVVVDVSHLNLLAASVGDRVPHGFGRRLT